VVRRRVKRCALKRANVTIVMLNGESLQGMETCDVIVDVRGKKISLNCVVVEKLPLNG